LRGFTYLIERLRTMQVATRFFVRRRHAHERTTGGRAAFFASRAHVMQ
jgi:hypothetical protein